jgi:hypothetical protein
VGASEVTHKFGWCLHHGYGDKSNGSIGPGGTWSQCQWFYLFFCVVWEGDMDSKYARTVYVAGSL